MEERSCLAISEWSENVESDADSSVQTLTHSSTAFTTDPNEEEIHFDFESLPHVVLLTILSCLSLRDLGRTSCVSKYLNYCCNYSGLWTKVDLSNRKQVDDAVLLRIVRISKSLTLLDISEAMNITEQGLLAALKECSTLVEFKAVRCCYVTNSCLQVLAEKCRSLRIVDFSMCHVISDEGVGQLCQGCTNLEQIRLNHCLQLTSKTLKHIANHCSFLKLLSVENNKFMNDDGVEELVSRCRKLQRLQLNSCGITRKSISKIAIYSHAMSVLDLRYCTSLDDEIVQQLVLSCKNLLILNLSLCFKVTDVSVAHISQYCTHLKSVYLVHCQITDAGLKTLSSSSSGLQWIDVSWCQKITDEGVRALLQGCKTLEHLGIVRCDLVTNNTIHELCVRYPSVYISSFMTELDRFMKKAVCKQHGNCDNVPKQQ